MYNKKQRTPWALMQEELKKFYFHYGDFALSRLKYLLFTLNSFVNPAIKVLSEIGVI